MAKKTREKWRTFEGVFDEFTLRTLFKLSSQGHFDELKSPITIGKEANVFSATTKDGGAVCVKIYRLQTCDFNRMYDHIKVDPRYINLKKQRRKVIFAWTQREFRNLMKARQAGVRVPKPIAFSNNVLVMELFGTIANPSPKLKDAIPSDLDKFFDLTIKNMKKLYDAKLVHGDLSPYNMLNDNEKPVLIDFLQCNPVESSVAEEWLERDVRIVMNFFKKYGLKIDEEKIKKKFEWKAE
jgi:RIO kinase 1